MSQFLEIRHLCMYSEYGTGTNSTRHRVESRKRGRAREG